MSNEQYPFPRFTHFGVTVTNRDKAVEHFEKIGLGPYRPFTFPSEPHFSFNFDLPLRMECAYGRIGESEIGLEIFEACNDITKELHEYNQKGEHVWHYGYDGRDHEECLDWMAKQGFPANEPPSPRFKEGNSSECCFQTLDIGHVHFQMHWMPEDTWLMTDFFGFKDYPPRTDTPLKTFNYAGAIVDDIDKAVAHYEKMGMGPFKKFSLPSASGFDYKEMTDPSMKFECAYGKFHSNQTTGLMLYQPVNVGETKMFDKSKGEYVWCLGFEVENVDEVAKWMSERGFQVAGSNTYADGTREVVFDTDEIGGLQILCHQFTKGSSLKDFVAFQEAKV